MPLSKDPALRQRQLENLRKGGRRAPSVPKIPSELEERLSRLSGSPAVVKTAKEFAALLESAGNPISALNAPSLILLSIAWQGMLACMADIQRYGAFRADGSARPAQELLAKYLAEARQHAEAMGLSPQIRAKLRFAESGVASGAWRDWLLSLFGATAGDPGPGDLPPALLPDDPSHKGGEQDG